MVKWIFSALLGLAGAFSLVLAVMEAPKARASSRPMLEPLALRPFTTSAPRPAATAPSAPTESPTPAAVVRAEEHATAVPAPDAGARPVPAVAARPPEATAPRAAPAAPMGDGVLNLRASDTADVYLDGRKIGSSPLNNVKTRSGPHKLRFDCYDAAGNAVAGQVKMITVVANDEQDIDYPCPESQ